MKKNHNWIILSKKKTLISVCGLSAILTLTMWKTSYLPTGTKTFQKNEIDINKSNIRTLSSYATENDFYEYYNGNENAIKNNYSYKKPNPLHFNMSGNDIIVFLHIQKTGGTSFGHHLTKNLNISNKCTGIRYRKKSNCFRPNSDKETWLVSRYSTGWICGLHADWLNLQNCVPEAILKQEGEEKPHRYIYITILRDPIKRYISEWSHTLRGATWKASKYKCNGREFNIPHCYKGNNWMQATLTEFITCPFNLGNNRQTRMLANLSEAGCYDLWINRTIPYIERIALEEKLLDSAKKNLKDMPFFGLVERQKDTQLLFEDTFNVNFIEELFQTNISKSFDDGITTEDVKKIKQVNDLDVQLYEFAVSLFNSRVEEYKRRALTST